MQIYFISVGELSFEESHELFRGAFTGNTISGIIILYPLLHRRVPLGGPARAESAPECPLHLEALGRPQRQVPGEPRPRRAA